MTTADTNAKVEANCEKMRQLRWLQKEYWQSYEHEIAKLVDENETLLKAETRKNADLTHDSVETTMRKSETPENGLLARSGSISAGGVE